MTSSTTDRWGAAVAAPHRAVRGAVRRAGAWLLIPILVLAQGCLSGTDNGNDTDNEASPPSVVVQRPAWRTVICRDGSPQECGQLPGVRFVLASGDFVRKWPTVVLDLGGPGADPLVAELQTTGLLLQIFQERNVLIPLEPWVYNEVTRVCQGSLNSLLTSVRESSFHVIDARSRVFADSCGEELAREAGFDGSSYRQIARASRAAGSPNVDLVAWSFGASRAREAVADGDFDRVLLASPFVSNRPMKRILATRTGRTLAALRDKADPELTQLLARAARRLPVELPQRSVLYTRFDLGASVISAAYEANGNGPLLKRGLETLSTRKFPVVDGDVGSRYLSTSADYLLGRYGRHQHYKGMLGYFGGFCSNGFNGIGPEVSRSGVVDQTLIKLHAPCAVIAKPQRSTPDRKVPTCIVSSTDDPVATPTDARMAFRRSRLVEIPAGGHAAFATGRRFTRLANAFLAHGLPGCK